MHSRYYCPACGTVQLVIWEWEGPRVVKHLLFDHSGDWEWHWCQGGRVDSRKDRAP